MSSHPDPQDLLNLARDQLGKKKSQRILDHCRECPPCADALLEVVRDQAPEGARPPMTRWQWVSIILFIVALVVVVVLMVWFVRGAAQTRPFDVDAADVSAPLLR